MAEDNKQAAYDTKSAESRQLSKYNIGNFKYPEDAGTSKDLPHTIVFYINVRGKGDSKTPPPNTLFEISDKAIVDKKGIIGGAAIAGTVAAAGSVLSSIDLHAASTKIMNGASVKQAIVSDLKKSGKNIMKAGLATGAVVGAAAFFDQTKMYRLKDAITLAVQEAPKTSYKVNYDAFDVGTLMGAGTANADQIASGDLSSVGSATVAALLKVAEVPTTFGAPEFAKGIQKMAGMGINPFRTALFKDVDLRTFTYRYKFMPKTKTEALSVKKIIETFKYHMHPEFSSDKVFLIHPSEFNIVYYYNGEENKNWHKIATCVLTSMELDAGSERLASFSDGMSVEINMTLTFMETEMLTKETISQGY